MKNILLKIFTILIVLPAIAVPCSVRGEVSSTPTTLKLVRAVMCESMQKLTPVNQAVAFSIDLGRVLCFTEFEQVTDKTFIHHKWYRRGNLISVQQLAVNPPRWSSFSSMQLRNVDKGPWRVDITDADDKLIATLRFSITD